jgi:hypothetical protein
MVFCCSDHAVMRSAVFGNDLSNGAPSAALAELSRMSFTSRKSFGNQPL